MTEKVENKVQTVVVVSSKRSGNDLARFAIAVDPILSGEKREKAIISEIISLLEWREDD